MLLRQLANVTMKQASLREHGDCSPPGGWEVKTTSQKSRGDRELAVCPSRECVLSNGRDTRSSHNKGTDWTAQGKTTWEGTCTHPTQLLAPLGHNFP